MRYVLFLGGLMLVFTSSLAHAAGTLGDGTGTQSLSMGLAALSLLVLAIAGAALLAWKAPRWAALAAIGFLGYIVAAPAFAQDTRVSVGPFYDLVAPYVFMAVSGAVVGLLTWGTRIFKNWAGIQIEARHREALHSAVMTGVSAALARGQLRASEISIDVKSQIVKEAIDWAQASVPDALKFIGVTPEALAELAMSKLTLLATGAIPDTSARKI